MKIEISDAKVSTAQVEVKTLAIKGKQVTLAVFRQIDVGDIMSLDIENFRYVLRGFPWGRVNYCTKDCRPHGDHLHIIWQFEDELRTCVVRSTLIEDAAWTDTGLRRGYSRGGFINLNYDIASPLLKKFKDYDDGEIMDMYGDVVESYRIIYESFTRLPLLFIAV